ncbi:maleylpyruvate isomerase family mycothiol-dependent enzyme [Gordonia sp. ABSL1-1]|uniref:maleylpyruvate isomerase family mycothiol-dependent enzyme n=1 Tax=Gordonia sp. ABSL1-1 TaxID=3053923 RepID=UPI002572392C|nr:maleylpyruvate isomerase family mycothiol-dependent enzyme [Gordonia sp. ABSL1-1]MDL9938153.1 maleylpyruvate isomerase family mycothiol-dependent enzyme [Gordonia sp. ABSL1-1]
MDSDEIWRHIDEQRADLADLADDFDDAQLSTSSLCDGWTVRDVIVHLSQAHMPPARAVLLAARSGFRFNTMIRRAAIAETITPKEATARIRAMAGSRRHAIGTGEIEPLADILVHGQDIVVPLGIARPMPSDAAAVCADRLWHMRYPFHPRRDFRGRRFIATDADLDRGEGEPVEAPVRDILMLFAGRRSAAGTLSGVPGPR